MQNVLWPFFGGRSAGDWKVNKEVLDVIGEMLARESNCSKAMDLVPRPGFRIDAGYIKRQLRDIARRVTSGDHSYYACQIAVSYKYKDRVKLASEGL
ncbi:MAG: hypothetical protein KZQ93_12270 [Candidatus Thiodiazotropha sp. (ex Monitilora ramsayi)]|nr:hypothetical protein [Candidatus Thiodiazotropha sp. (ex Monitilora ramsayi)]